MNEGSPVRIVRTDVVHRAAKFTVVEDVQELPDGSRVSWQSVVFREAVLALPIDREGQVYLVRQFRAQLGGETLEVVGGGLEDGHTPAEAIRRELAEEAGIEAALIPLGAAELGVSTARCRQHLFLAVVERIGAPALEPFEEITIRGVERMPLSRAVDLVMDGTIRDVTSRTTILMAAEHVRRHGLPGARNGHA